MKLQNSTEFVGLIKVELGITERWTADTDDYKTFFQENVSTSYAKALDELEHLVVMRLFELAKLSTSGTGITFIFHIFPGMPNQNLAGYKLRRQISKALQRRLEAI